MESQETIICRLCLKICDNFKAIEGDTKGVLDVLLPKIDLAATQQPVMCINCANQLTICVDFKTMCIYTHNYLLPFVNKHAVKLDLRDVYLIKNESSTGVPEDQAICGFCISPVKSCSAISLDVGQDRDVMLTHMIEQCLPDLDLNIISTPVICACCHESLENCFHFVTNCLTVEENIKKYRESLDIKGKSEIELNNLLEFTIRNITTNEVDGNFVEKIKLENEEGSKTLDAIKIEETFCEENEIKMENFLEMEDKKFLLSEEIQIKTDQSDINRFDDGVILPQPKDTSKLHRNQKRKMPNLKGDPLKLHIRGKIKCDYCSYQTSRKGDLNIHLLTHKDPSEVKMYKCESCSYQAKRKSCITRHMLKHKDLSEVTVYKCDSCTYQTKDKYNIKRHLLKHKDPSEVTMYKCEFCLYQTNEKYGLKRHLLTHKKPSKVTMYKCADCSYQTSDRHSFKVHLLKHKDPSKVPIYKCESCSYQSNRKDSLKQHLLKHKDPSEVTMYKCDSCLYQTRDKSNLKSHLLKHKDPSKVTMYKCDDCSYQTIFNSGFKMHLLKHKDSSEVIMYKCDFCSYKTINKYIFKTHLLVHKDPAERTEYKCDSCSYKTLNKYNFKTHLVVHKDPAERTVYTCDSCSYKSFYKSKLKVHFQKHKDPSEATMYKCDSCSFQTIYKYCLKTHLLRHKDS